MISHITNNLIEGWTNGRKLEEVWTSGYKIWPSEEVQDGEMVLNITTQSNNFKLNLFDYVGGNDIDDAIIDWGDENDTTTIDSSTSSLSHTYTSIGDYQIKISGEIKWKGKEQSAPQSSLSISLTSIELPTNNSPIVDIGAHGFDYFANLTTIPKGLFDKCTEVTDFTSCFHRCTSLQSIPQGLFDNNTAVTDFSYCFNTCTKLQSIPKGLFDKCVGATNFSYCFNSCSRLQSIPKGLFDNNTEVTNFHRCFYGCSNLQSIPKGLFDNNTLVTDFGNCFNRCRSLQSIPEGLFDNNTAVTSFYNCFYSCTSLRSIPECLFDNNTLVTDFGNCFYSCPLQSIPEGLFDNNTLVTTFSGCFSYCTSLQSIPEGLFDKCTEVTNFYHCFYNCTSVTSNLPTLWISHSSASHNYCFYGCTQSPNYQEAYAAGWVTSLVVSLTLNILQDNQSIDLSSYIKPTGDSTNIDIEWGDNSEQESTSIHNIQHTYANKGEYAVEIYGDIEWVEPKARSMQSGWSISLSKY